MSTFSSNFLFMKKFCWFCCCRRTHCWVWNGSNLCLLSWIFSSSTGSTPWPSNCYPQCPGSRPEACNKEVEDVEQLALIDSLQSPVDHVKLLVWEGFDIRLCKGKANLFSALFLTFLKFIRLMMVENSLGWQAPIRSS